MVWDEARQDRSLYEYHQTLIRLRRHSPALQRGSFQILLIEPDTVAFQRESLEDRILVIAHRGDEPRPAAPLPVINAGIPDGTRFIDLESGDELIVSHGALNLPQIDQGATLLRQVR